MSKHGRPFDASEQQTGQHRGINEPRAGGTSVGLCRISTGARKAVSMRVTGAHIEWRFTGEPCSFVAAASASLPARCERYRYFSPRFDCLGCSSAYPDFSLGRLPRHGDPDRCVSNLARLRVSRAAALSRANRVFKAPRSVQVALPHPARQRSRRFHRCTRRDRHHYHQCRRYGEETLKAKNAFR
jgi:hypothetical protein